LYKRKVREYGEIMKKVGYLNQSKLKLLDKTVGDLGSSQGVLGQKVGKRMNGIIKSC